MFLRRCILFLSRLKWLRRWAENSALAQPLTRRFVAGQTRAEALAVCQRLNREGLLVTIDCLGESVEDPREAERSREEYLRLIEDIARHRLLATVSVKLTHFGLDVSESLCWALVGDVARHAHQHGTAVEVDMEGPEYVDRTLRLVRQLHREHGCVRAVIQAYLRRSEQDILLLCAEGIPVRLCKGAYSAPPALAFQSRREIRTNFLRLAKILLSQGTEPAFATHDARLIAQLESSARTDGRPRSDVEFQMLYGVREVLHGPLRRAGFKVRLYVPYGLAWYPYFMRRLAEHPANLLFLFRNLFRRAL